MRLHIEFSTTMVDDNRSVAWQRINRIFTSKDELRTAIDHLINLHIDTLDCFAIRFIAVESVTPWP